MREDGWGRGVSEVTAPSETLERGEFLLHVPEVIPNSGGWCKDETGGREVGMCGGRGGGVGRGAGGRRGGYGS